MLITIGAILLVVAVISLIMAFFTDTSELMIVVGFSVMLGGLCLAFGLTEPEPPDCAKVYAPDGSYVETCEYPAEDSE